MMQKCVLNSQVSNHDSHDKGKCHRMDFHLLSECCGIEYTKAIDTCNFIQPMLEKVKDSQKPLPGPSPQGGSNSRPLVYKTSALTTELWRLQLFFYHLWSLTFFCTLAM